MADAPDDVPDDSTDSGMENVDGAFVTMPGHDIGAVGRTKDSSKKKPSKKRLMKALQKSIDENNALRERLISLSTDQSMGNGNRPVHSSTMREENPEPRNESLLLSSMNSWTLGALNIPECVPTAGESEIDKRAFEHWKDILVSSLQLVTSADEQAKFGVFKIKSGPRLREIFNTTVSTPGMPDEMTAPFSNAIARLDDYFGSRTYILAQRGKLMNLSQSPSESSVEFVRRVSSAAKLCNYSKDEEMEAVVRVMTKGATDSRVRVLTRRNWVKQGTMKDLIDLVRDHELEIANEEDFQRIHRHKEPATVASVSSTRNDFRTQRQGNFNADRPSVSNTRGDFQRQRQGNYNADFQRQRQGNYNADWRGRGSMFRGYRGPRRGGRGFNRGMLRNQSGNNCWRCGSIFHRSFDCPEADQPCIKCGRVGHVARVCTSSNEETQSKSWKRPIDSEDRGVPRKIAAIESSSEQRETVKEVQNPVEDPE